MQIYAILFIYLRCPHINPACKLAPIRRAIDFPDSAIAEVVSEIKFNRKNKHNEELASKYKYTQ